MNPSWQILTQWRMGAARIAIPAPSIKGCPNGSAVSREVRERSEGFFEFRPGFLYPALWRTEEPSPIYGYQKDSDDGLPRKSCRPARAGRERAEAGREAWGEFGKRFDRIPAPAGRQAGWRAVLERNRMSEGYGPAEAKDLVRLAAS
jgi:DNA-binding PadR family transcriptional regulator